MLALRRRRARGDAALGCLKRDEVHPDALVAEVTPGVAGRDLGDADDQQAEPAQLDVTADAVLAFMEGGSPPQCALQVLPSPLELQVRLRARASPSSSACCPRSGSATCRRSRVAVETAELGAGQLAPLATWTLPVPLARRASLRKPTKRDCSRAFQLMVRRSESRRSCALFVGMSIDTGRFGTRSSKMGVSSVRAGWVVLYAECSRPSRHFPNPIPGQSLLPTPTCLLTSTRRRSTSTRRHFTSHSVGSSKQIGPRIIRLSRSRSR